MFLKKYMFYLEKGEYFEDSQDEHGLHPSQIFGNPPFLKYGKKG